MLVLTMMMMMMMHCKSKPKGVALFSYVLTKFLFAPEKAGHFCLSKDEMDVLMHTNKKYI